MGYDVCVYNSYVRHSYDDVSKGYGLTIFKMCKSADYYKIVEATEIVGSRGKP